RRQIASVRAGPQAGHPPESLLARRSSRPRPRVQALSTRKIVTKEERRLQQSQERIAHWKRWGPYLAERQWGTGGQDYTPHATARDSCHPRPPSPGPVPLDRPRSDPERAPLRAYRQRRQPRRGREGVLLLPRLDTDALVHEVPLQVSAGGVSLR